MGRMFRIITDGGFTDPNRGGAVAISDADPYVNGGAPFIEVGAPSGPVQSLPKPAPTPAPAPTKPQDQRYLSVALQQIAPQPVQPLLNTVAADIVAFHHPDHPVSREYFSLADDLRRQIGQDGPKAILFTAASSDNGTTTVLLNLAVTLAAEPGVRVLAVDADLARPTAARKFGLVDVPGLAEVLARSTPLAWALQPTAVPALQLLAAGQPTAQTPEALADDFPKLIAQLRQWFDWVLIDGGVWGEHPERDAHGPAFDGVYLVTREADQTTPAVAAVQADVTRNGGLLRGFITTKA
jgi:Mrp family chromosome partitioning ATPase